MIVAASPVETPPRNGPFFASQPANARMLEKRSSWMCVRSDANSSIDGPGAAQNVVDRPDPFDDARHAAREHRDLAALIGFASCCLWPGTVDDRDRRVIAGGAKVCELRQNVALGAEGSVNGVDSDTRLLGDALDRGRRVSAFRKPSLRCLEDANPRVPCLFLAELGGVRAPGLDFAHEMRLAWAGRS